MPPSTIRPCYAIGNLNSPLFSSSRLPSLLCGIRLDSGIAATGARPPSLVGYLGTQAEAVRDAYMTKLNDPHERGTMPPQVCLRLTGHH